MELGGTSIYDLTYEYVQYTVQNYCMQRMMWRWNELQLKKAFPERIKRGGEGVPK